MVFCLIQRKNNFMIQDKWILMVIKDKALEVWEEALTQLKSSRCSSMEEAWEEWEAWVVWGEWAVILEASLQWEEAAKEDKVLPLDLADCYIL